MITREISLDTAENEPLKVWGSLTYLPRNLNLSTPHPAGSGSGSRNNDNDDNEACSTLAALCFDCCGRSRIGAIRCHSVAR